MKKKVLLTLLLVLVSAVLLAGCATGLTPFSWSGIATDEKQAYVAGGSFVYAVDLTTGVEAWRFPEKASTANPFYAQPVLSTDGQLVIGGFDRKLYSLNPATAAENWVFAEARDRYFGSVLIQDDVVYAPNADYRLYAVNLKNGALLWSFRADQSLWSAPVSNGSSVFFGTVGGTVYSLKTADGSLNWETAVDSAVLGSPYYTDGILYVTSYEGGFTALNAASGEILWTRPITGRVWSGPVPAGELLIFGDTSGVLHAFNLQGAEQWSQSLNGSVIASPLVQGKSLVAVTSLGNIYFTDLEGSEITPISITGEIYASPVAAGEFFLLSPTEGSGLVIALDQNGTQRWVFSPAKSTTK